MANYRVWTKREVNPLPSNGNVNGSSSQCAVVRDWMNAGGTPRASGYDTTLLSQHTAVTESRNRTPVYIVVSPTYYNKKVTGVSGQLPTTTGGFRATGLTQSDFRYYGTVGSTANCYIACIGATAVNISTSGTFSSGVLYFNDGTNTGSANRTFQYNTYDTIPSYLILFGV